MIELAPRLVLLSSLVVPFAVCGCGGSTPHFQDAEVPIGRMCSPTGAPPGPSADAGAAVDTSIPDSGPTDTGVADTAVADTGVADTGVADTGVADGAVGGMDSGSVDPGAGLPGCPAGQVCLDYHCYATCGSDDDCADSERCGSDGACVPRTSPRPDAGPADTGPPDPCATVTCSDPTPVCNPLLGECQACGLDLGLTSCNPRTQVCEVARGRCTDFDATTLATTCAPCNTSADCAGGATCLTRDDPVERVCVPSCDAMTPCPRGLACDASGQCLPTVGSCFEFRGSADGRACVDVGQCAPIGASTGNVTCRGSDADAGVAGQCESTCMADTDCPDNTDCFMGFCHKWTPCGGAGDCPGGLSCGPDSFCHPPPAM